MTTVESVVQILAVLTVIGQVVAFVILILMLMKHPLVKKISANALTLMLVVALISTIGSLFLSDVALWTPCKLCWYQRIFMYPQVILLAVALWKKDRSIAPYILTLSVIGGVIAALHYGEQVSAALWPEVVDPNVPCDTSGVSCASTPFFRFGYITIPMMALTAFILNIVGSASMMLTKKK